MPRTWRPSEEMAEEAEAVGTPVEAAEVAVDAVHAVEEELGAEAEAGAVQGAPLRLASEQALRQAREEGLTLRAGKNSTGYLAQCEVQREHLRQAEKAEELQEDLRFVRGTAAVDVVHSALQSDGQFALSGGSRAAPPAPTGKQAALRELQEAGEGRSSTGGNRAARIRMQ